MTGNWELEAKFLQISQEGLKPGLFYCCVVARLKPCPCYKAICWRITGIYEKVIKVKADVAAVLD